MKRPKTLPEAIARLEMAEHNLRAMRRMYDELLARALPSQRAAAAADPVDLDLPPDVVMAAMQAISPVPDKTYEANWQYWERNKARAKAYPEDFAEEIIRGAVWEPMVEPQTEILVIPEREVPVS